MDDFGLGNANDPVRGFRYPSAKLGFFIDAVPVGEGHSGAAHRRVGRIKDAYWIAVFPQSPELVFLAEDLKEFLRFRNGIPPRAAVRSDAGPPL